MSGVADDEQAQQISQLREEINALRAALLTILHPGNPFHILPERTRARAMRRVEDSVKTAQPDQSRP